MLKYEFFFFFSYQLYSCSSFLTAGAGGTISQAERVLDLVATPETKFFIVYQNLLHIAYSTCFYTYLAWAAVSDSARRLRRPAVVAAAAAAVGPPRRLTLNWPST